MTRLPYRLLAADLDGTLISSDHQFSPRVRRAVEKVQEAGILFTLATGRNWRTTSLYAGQLGVSLPLICYQGGLIVEPGGQALYQKALDRNLAADVIKLSQSHGWQVHLYQDGMLYLTEMHESPEFYTALLSPDARCVPDLLELLDHDPDKILFVAEGNADELHAELRQHLEGRVQIVRSHQRFVEVTPLGATKATGLEWLAEYLGVAQAEVMAIGDQDNDAPMLAWAGLGVAMGNASALCKSAADWVAPPVAEDGAAVAFERFLLNGYPEPEG